MSVDVIDNDCNKTFDNSKWVTGEWFLSPKLFTVLLYFSLNTEDKTINYNNMDELEKKIKNEV